MRHCIPATALASLLVFCGVACLQAQNLNVTARVEVTHQSAHSSHGNSAGVVLWLTPLQKLTDLPPRKQQEYTLTQKDKKFIPHILVVPTGSNISFPNQDPFFHNVFSLFNGKRFDLGLYEGHTRRSVLFDREGVSFIFCNIHPDMGAVVISLTTPFYATSAPDGVIELHDVPPGKYRLNVWAENVPADHLNELSRTVDISPQNTQLETLHLQTSGDVMNEHTNKFGEAYKPVPKQPY